MDRTRSDRTWQQPLPVASESSNLFLFLPYSTALLLPWVTLTLSLPQHNTSLTSTNTAATLSSANTLSAAASPSPPPPPPPSPPSPRLALSHVREHLDPTVVTLRYATLRLSRQNCPTVAREHLETRADSLPALAPCTALHRCDHQLQHSPPPLHSVQHITHAIENPPHYRRRRRLYTTLGTLVRYTTIPACRLVSSKARSRARSCRLVYAEG